MGAGVPAGGPADSSKSARTLPTAGRCGWRLLAQLGEQTEHLEVEPDQGHEQPERREPLHAAGRTRGAGLLDEVEVEQEVERRHADDGQADEDADSPGVVDE